MKRHPLAKTQERFEEEVFDLVGKEYTVIGTYVRTGDKLRIKHNECGFEWDITPNGFLRGKRCPKCMKKRAAKRLLLSQEEFALRLSEKHGEEYVILKGYESSTKKVKVKHISCGYEWSVMPSGLINGKCPKCSQIEKGISSRKTHEQYSEEVYKLVGDEYKIVGKYIKSDIKVRMLHKKCGNTWEVNSHKFLSGSSCPYCMDINYNKNTEQFKVEVNSITDGEFELVGEYNGAKRHTEIIHKKCGYINSVTPTNFLSGGRCPRCKSSKGEELISNILSEMNIEFKTEYTFDDCIYTSKLRFDFAIMKGTDVVALIEFDGEQHFKPVEMFGGVEYLKEVLIRDGIKNKYCESNNIPLIRVPHYEKDLENYVKNKIETLLATV